MQSYIQNYEVINSKVVDSEKIVLIADLHDLKINRMKNVIDDINKVGAKFVALVGDIMQGYKYGISKEIQDLSKTLAALSENQPLVLSLGNHDLVGLTKEGRNNFLRLENIRPGSIFPLDNKQVVIDNFRITGFCPSRKAFKLSYQNNGKASYVFANDFNRTFLKPQNDQKIEVLMNHDPHSISGSIVQNLVPNMKKFDIILSGHLHNGYILSRKNLADPCKYLDYGFREMPYEPWKMRPWIYTKTNLCRGISYIDKDGYRLLQLSNNEFFYANDCDMIKFVDINNNDYSDFSKKTLEEVYKIIKNNELIPIVITGGINKFFSLPIDKCEITTINLVNENKLIKKI